MAIKETEFFLFSNNEPTSSEFNRRNKTSRSYYGCFHACAIQLKDHPDITNTQQHAAFINELKASSRPALRTLGLKLHSLKIRRVKADYFLDADFTKSEHKTFKIEISQLLEHLPACS